MFLCFRDYVGSVVFWNWCKRRRPTDTIRAYTSIPMDIVNLYFGVLRVLGDVILAVKPGFDSTAFGIAAFTHKTFNVSLSFEQAHAVAVTLWLFCFYAYINLIAFFVFVFLLRRSFGIGVRVIGQRFV